MYFEESKIRIQMPTVNAQTSSKSSQMVGKRKTREYSTSPSPKRRKVDNKDEDDPASWTVVELRDWLKDNDLPSAGNKAVLVQRVQDKKDGKEVAAPTKKAPTRTSTRKPVKKKVVDPESESEDEPMSDSEPSDGEESEDEKVETKTTSTRTSARTSNRISNKKEANEKSGQWKKHESILYCVRDDSKDSVKIAAFDMDSTLITPSSGKTHPQGRSDWRWLFDCVPDKLKELHENGYKIVIISNQKGISKGQTTAATVQGKIDDLQKDCGVPLCAILATEDDEYRKPSPCMWHFMSEKMVNGEIDMKASYYIGDAAGRPAGWQPGRKKDFGCGDRKFAANVGVDFKTPEEFFLGEDPVAFEWRSYDPTKLKEHDDNPYDAKSYISGDKEMILFVGYPASGKSTFAREVLVPNGYVHINRDTLGTMPKCIKATKEAMEQGKRVVVDNTNPSSSAREKFIKVAESYGYPVRCFHFQAPIELAKHLNSFRENISKGVQKHVPGVGYNMFKKHFQEPSKSEGISEIKKIEFKRFHPDEEHKKLFDHWTEL